MRTLILLVFSAALAACQPGDGGPAGTAEPTTPAATAVAERWTLPAASPAAQPDLVATPDGDLLLSWVHAAGDSHALMFARWHDGRWSAPRTIARGDDWFVNWADTPHIAATPDGALWAHWLQKSAAAAYAYDVMLVRSDDGGEHWSAPVRVNDDGTPTEHGFVSLWPAEQGELGVAWLDGRETAGGHEGHAGSSASDSSTHAPHHGDASQENDEPAAPAMTLRSARFDADLARHDETRIDAMTCDCCQTDAVATPRGPLLFYRDRSAGEIRDIAVVRRVGGHWTAPVPVHADGWRMAACPVNGPAADARGEAVVVGWYTAAGGTAALKLARSDDAGGQFGPPVLVDRGDAVQGRVDVALADDAVWVLWLREDAEGQSLQLARYSPDLSQQQARLEVAHLQGRGRGTGFPQLAVAGGIAHLVWADLVDGAPRLHGARIVPASHPAPPDLL